MKLLFVIILILNIATSCTIKSFLYYSRDGLDYNRTLKLIKNAPRQRDMNLNHFIKDIALIDAEKIPELRQEFCKIRSGLLIDEDGQIQAIALLNSFDPTLDSLVLDALKSFKFKQILSGSKIIKYSVGVDYLFHEGNPSSPFINGLFSKSIFDDTQQTIFQYEFSDSIHHNDVFEFYKVDKKPEIIYKSLPKYPVLSRKAGKQGYVVVSILIDEQGNVIDAKIFKGIDPFLDNASIEAALQCKFKPAFSDGNPIKVRMNIPFQFKLR